jgi:AcrR family transcriptional regulator
MRQALLGAAVEVFAAKGYDNAGLRDIALKAGGDARLIGRYFGSKESLFAEAVDAAYEKRKPISAETAHDVAKSLLAGKDDQQHQALLLTLRSASNERAAMIMRERIESDYQRDVAAGLTGTDAKGRAALLISICAGVQLLRNVLHDSALTEAAADDLVPYLEAALRAIAAPGSAS